MDSYLEHGSVKSAWMTIFILTIIWGVLYAVRPLFTKPNEISDPETADKRPTTNSMLNHIDLGYSVIKENTLMLLVCLCFNSFGTASTKALSVFSWIFFGCTIFFALIVMSYDNKMIRAAGGVVFFALALVMNILALAHGW